MNRWHLVVAFMGVIAFIEAVFLVVNAFALFFGINYVGGIMEWLAMITYPFYPAIIATWAYDLAKTRKEEELRAQVGMGMDSDKEDEKHEV